MFKFGSLFNALLLLAVSSIIACAQSQQCELDNPSLRAMPAVSIKITRQDGSSLELTAKLADTNATRAAGFQRVCQATIEKTPILFTYPYQLMPRFHMNNVVAPIDIAFIDKRGGIESVQAMKPYFIGAVNKPEYGPSRPIIAALEAHQGFFEKHAVDVTSKISWQAVPATEPSK